jgi:hypothetical protein
MLQKRRLRHQEGPSQRAAHGTFGTFRCAGSKDSFPLLAEIQTGTPRASASVARMNRSGAIRGIGWPADAWTRIARHWRSIRATDLLPPPLGGRVGEGVFARMPLCEKKFPPFHPPPPTPPYTPRIPSPEGACSRPPGSRGEGAAPAPVGARQARCLRGKRTRPSRGSPPPPLRHYDRSALEAEKAWNGDLQTPCGSAGEARLYNAAPSRRSLTPRPVPDRCPGGGCGMGE